MLSYASTQKLHAIYRVNVEVENTSSEAVRPTFATLNGEITPITEIWRSDGPALIAPHSHREVALVAPSVAAMPLEHTNWGVVAFTQSPNAISASATQRGEPVLYAALTPSAVPQPVPAGHALSFWVRVFRSNGIPIETGGLLVDLRATGIDSSVPPAALRINGLPSGRTATQRTGAHGLAQFTVVGEPTRETTVLLRASVLRKQGTAEEKGQIVPSPSPSAVAAGRSKRRDCAFRARRNRCVGARIGSARFASLGAMGSRSQVIDDACARVGSASASYPGEDDRQPGAGQAAELMVHVREHSGRRPESAPRSSMQPSRAARR